MALILKKDGNSIKLSDDLASEGNVLAIDAEGNVVTTEAPGGSFEGDMDDIDDGATYVKTENNYTDEEKTKLDGLTGGLTQGQIKRLIR